MRAGIDAACRPGVRAISAGNYGGKLGPHHFHLRQIMEGGVSDAVVLTLRAPLAATLDMSGVSPDRCARCRDAEIAALPVWLGREPARAGRRVRRARRARAARRDRGRSRQGLRRGRRDDQQDCCTSAATSATTRGMAMSGGVLRIDGNAGDRLGGPSPGASKGMTGGEVVVFGSAGASAARWSAAVSWRWRAAWARMRDAG